MNRKEGPATADKREQPAPQRSQPRTCGSQRLGLRDRSDAGHHYLPRAYLRRFVDESGALWAFDRRRQEVRAQRPEGTAAERELSTLESDAEQSREVETFLAKEVDGPGLAAIASLEEGIALQPSDWGALARFVAAGYLRTPAFRAQAKTLQEQIRDALVKWGADPTTASEPSPVVIARPDEYPDFRGVGLRTPGAEKIVPLSPRIGLLMRDERPDSRVSVGVIDADRLRRINKTLMIQSERFTFSRSEALLRSLVARVRPEAEPAPRVQVGGGIGEN